MKHLPLAILCATAPLAFSQAEKPKLPATPETAETVQVPEGAIAHVLGKPVQAEDREDLTGVIFGQLLEAYAKEKKIEATEEEINAFIAKTVEMEKEDREKFEQDRKRLTEELKSGKLTADQRKEKEDELAMKEEFLKATNLSPEDAKQVEKETREMARQYIRSWKINRELFRQYGGRAIFQQAGPEPLDAYRDFLREQEKKGAFLIKDEEAKKEFWKYFTDESMHTFYNAADSKKAIETPWWLMDKPLGE